jgi:DNA-binding NarL/FixJ family response regulator
MPLRLVIADDSFLVREALTELLAGAPDLEVAAVVADVQALHEAVERELPDVVLSDIRMPPFGESEGIRAAAELRHSHPEMGVVILSQYAEVEYALELFDAGSAGRAYLLKERIGNRGDLIAAIEAVAAGGSVVDPKIVDALVAERSRAADSPLGELTSRERQVLAELAQGKSNSAIASSLFLTKRAVEKHINAIFMKLQLRDAQDVSSRVAATLIFLSAEGGAPPPPPPPVPSPEL